MAFINNKVYYDYCDAYEQQYKCLSTAIHYFTDWHRSYTFRSDIELVMNIYDKKPVESLKAVSHVFFTIATILYWFVIARVITQLYVRRTGNNKQWLRFLIEFVIIALPSIICINFANKWVEVIVLTMTVILCFVVRRTKCIEKAKDKEFELGTRPYVFTLLRSTVYIWTVLCILAIDFPSFPHHFRKSRSYGAALMDVGIGLFVTVMAAVSKRLRNFASFKHTLVAVVLLFVLGTARTSVVIYLSYGQDDHEYGKHLNAFFILGFTKLFGALCSALAKTDMQLLPLSIGIIAFHELILQAGLQDYVINPHVERSDIFSANREGLSSILGFVGLYLLCMFIYKHLNIQGTLHYTLMIKRIKSIFILVIAFLFLTICSILTTGISRVTCNFGYIVWVITLTITMTWLYLIVFDLVLNTFLPVAAIANDDNLEKSTLQPNNKLMHFLPVPLITDSINMNGLLYFLVGNLLTGFVNIFLNPDESTDLKCFVILVLYLFLTNAFVFVLYCFKIRIA